MAKEIMIDFETLDTGKSCVLLSVGMVIFDLDTGETFAEDYFTCNRDSQILAGRSIGESTLAWWDRQSNEAKVVFEQAESIGLHWEHVLDRISAFIGVVKGATVWSNGANFDIAILEEAYWRANRKLPWVFWKSECVRTMHSICKRVTGEACKKLVPAPTVAHNALADCHYQIAYTCLAFKKVKEHNNGN